ncbi:MULTISPECIES: hypothetical protein [Streptococcus]|uniref:hypothetical protein n=1 Tax=Streptococcus TaxID=1301 RepID=UPI0022842CB6|nr:MULTISPECIES: hypothetical protein [Streptococcus]MCY7022991.1 hypothetical protein [Streptococcus sanguinis]MDQ8691774.1 hypothetical protein [Streptococcus sp. IsoGale022]
MKTIKSTLLVVSIILVFIGSFIIVQNKNLFTHGTKQEKKKEQDPHEKQLAYLKKHEEELADFVKALNSKVESVQFDWDSMKVEDIGNGTPQGGGYILTLDGRINSNKDTEFTLGIPLNYDSNEVPEELVIYEMQPIRILEGNVWDIYE